VRARAAIYVALWSTVSSAPHAAAILRQSPLAARKRQKPSAHCRAAAKRQAQRMCEATDRQAIPIGATAAGWDSCYTSSASEPMLNAPLNSDGHLKVGHYKQCSSCPHRTPDPESTRICAKPHSQWQRMASTCDAISALTFEIVAVVSRFDSGNSLPLQTNQGRRSLSVQAPRRTKATAG